MACVDCALNAEAVPIETCVTCGYGQAMVGKAGPAIACAVRPQDATVKDIMKENVISVTASLSIERLVLLLIDHGIAQVPVVDPERRPIGMASKTDLVFDRYEWAERRDEAECLKGVGPAPKGFTAPVPPEQPALTVRDVMSGEPITVKRNTRLVDCGALMADRGMHACPVVDDDGVLCGIITSLDLARWVGGWR